jgi:acyl carrier protein
MKNLEIIQNIFTNSLGVELNQLEELKYNEVPSWDSIGHMSLMTEIEDAFDIFLEVDDIINFSSFKAGLEILKKYNVEF